MVYPALLAARLPHKDDQQVARDAELLLKGKSRTHGKTKGLHATEL